MTAGTFRGSSRDATDCAGDFDALLIGVPSLPERDARWLGGDEVRRSKSSRWPDRPASCPRTLDRRADPSPGRAEQCARSSEGAAPSGRGPPGCS